MSSSRSRNLLLLFYLFLFPTAKALVTTHRNEDNKERLVL